MSKKRSSKKSKSEGQQPELPDNRFINRELSWLEFNQRVLDQAADESIPLLERAKFLAITSSNLDEFMMVRVGGLMLHRNSMARDPAGMTVSEQLNEVLAMCQVFVQRQYGLLQRSVEPQLAAGGIHRIDLGDCDDSRLQAAEAKFGEEIYAVLSPQSLANRPFPLLPGLGMYLCVRLRREAPAVPTVEDADEPLWDFAVIPLGKSLPRIVSLPNDHGTAFVLLEDLVKRFVDAFFPGREVVECVPFRVTRNADVELREDEAGDLLMGMAEVLEGRRISRAVRLEYGSGASDEIISLLSESLNTSHLNLFEIDGPLDLTYLYSLHGLEGYDSLRYEPWPGQLSPEIDPADSIFETIKQGDLLLVHPYDRFDPVVRLIEEAAEDESVLAIKQILYRTSRNSPIVAALKQAAENGKYVSVIVELKARFDEQRNIGWAREMEQAGVQVIYGIRGLKTHAKVCVIVRRESDGLTRYQHFGTGNYNEATAKLYSDVSLLTCDGVLGGDATAFFNAVTGASQPQQMQELAAAPTTLRKKILDLIHAETQRSLEGQSAEIVAKLNSLVDTEVIDSLYRASQAGVKVRLNVRGICCLKPGVKGLSESIEVVSIVDRFLEHARVIYFAHGGSGQIFISSADWMPRNLDRRVELMTPVNDPDCRSSLLFALRAYFQDNQNSWRMLPEGQYERSRPGKNEKPVRAQRLLYEEAIQAVQESAQSGRTTFQAHRSRRRE